MLRRRGFLSLSVTAAVAIAANVMHAALHADPSTLDLGRARQETTLQAKVKLSNPGTTPLQILRVGADCSCTAATPVKTTLQPGESTELLASFETRSYQGEVHRRLLVQTSDGDLVLPVKAVVSAYDDWNLEAPMAVLPPSNRGETVKGVFKVEYAGAGTGEITKVETEAPWLTATMAERHGKQWTVALAKAANAPAGNLQPKLILHTSDAKEPQLTVPVFVAVYSALLVKPNPILLPITKVGQRVGMPFSISGWDAKVDPRGEVDEGTVAMQQRDGREVLMSLNVTPSQVGTSTRLMRLYAGDELEIEIPVIVRAE